MKRLLGAHMSIAGGFDRAVQRGESVGCTAVQIFTKNASRWRARPIAAQDAQNFRTAWQQSRIGPILAHDAYLINLASPKPAVREKSRSALIDELLRCHQLGIDALVMHPGAHLGDGETAGLRRICEALAEVLAATPSEVRLLIENTAGQGSSLGADFVHLASLLDGCASPRVSICFDTCHAHAAGYELATEAGYAQTMAEFDRLVGLEQIAAFHLNDSRREAGSRVDRHAHIGQGTIGRTGFACLMRDVRFAQLPMILETPKGEADDMDQINLTLLHSLAGGAG